MVNIRFALQAALEKRLISSEQKRYLLRIAKHLYFPQRTYCRVLHLAADRLSFAQAAALKIFLEQDMLDLKRLDAIELLHRIVDMKLSCDEQFNIVSGAIDG